MTCFTIYCRDRNGTAQARKDSAFDHLSHVEKHMDRYLVAGPLRDEDGHTVGSLLVVKSDTAEDAMLFLKQDPYFAADIWDSIEIHDFMAAAGDWVGGKNW